MTVSPVPKLPIVKKTPVKTTSLDTTIVLGKRVGLITPQTTYADLVKHFDKKRLTATKFYGAEGQVQLPSTTISTGRNRSIAVVWKNTKKLQPLMVTIHDPAWKTADGIGIGTSLAKLRQVLGEFKITGLYWDYGNQVIGLSPAARGKHPGLKLAVDADYTAGRKFPKNLKAVTGDKVILSASSPQWQPLTMHVTAMSVTFVSTPQPKKQ